MSECDIYSQSLLCLGHGLALYEPDPAGEYDEIRIGDVGHTENGAFHRLFNITFPDDHDINGRGVPEGFEPLSLTEDKLYKRNPLPAGAMCSATVASQGGGVGATLGPGLPLQAGASVHLSCSNKLGAALITSHPSYRLDTSSTLTLSQYMLKHYRSWVHFARDRLGRDVHVRDLVLVTGRDLTKQWATATFMEKARDAGISFQVGDGFGSILGQTGLSLWGSWSSNVSVPHRCGPVDVDPPTEEDSSQLRIEDPTAIDRSPSPSSASKYNQCVFLRGFRVRERARLFPKVIKAAAEGADEIDGKDDDPPPPSSSSLTSTVLDRSANTSTDSARVEAIHGVPGRDPRSDRDAYDVMARFIFENTDAEVALLHDSEVCVPFMRKVIETLEELMDVLRVDLKESAGLEMEVMDGVKVGRWVPSREISVVTNQHPSESGTVDIAKEPPTPSSVVEESRQEKDGRHVSSPQSIEQPSEPVRASRYVRIENDVQNNGSSNSHSRSHSPTITAGRDRMRHKSSSVTWDEKEGTVVNREPEHYQKFSQDFKQLQTKYNKGTLEVGDLTAPTKSLILGVMESNKEMMGYMRNLNVWLERDAKDRDAQIRSVMARLDSERRPDYARASVPETEKERESNLGLRAIPEEGDEDERTLVNSTVSYGRPHRKSSIDKAVGNANLGKYSLPTPPQSLEMTRAQLPSDLKMPHIFAPPANFAEKIAPLTDATPFVPPPVVYNVVPQPYEHDIKNMTYPHGYAPNTAADRHKESGRTDKGKSVSYSHDAAPESGPSDPSRSRRNIRKTTVESVPESGTDPRPTRPVSPSSSSSSESDARRHRRYRHISSSRPSRSHVPPASYSAYTPPFAMQAPPPQPYQVPVAPPHMMQPGLMGAYTPAPPAYNSYGSMVAPVGMTPFPGDFYGDNPYIPTSMQSSYDYTYRPPSYSRISAPPPSYSYNYRPSSYTQYPTQPPPASYMHPTYVEPVGSSYAQPVPGASVYAPGYSVPTVVPPAPIPQPIVIPQAPAQQPIVVRAPSPAPVIISSPARPTEIVISDHRRRRSRSPHRHYSVDSDRRRTRSPIRSPTPVRGRSPYRSPVPAPVLTVINEEEPTTPRRRLAMLRNDFDKGKEVLATMSTNLDPIMNTMVTQMRDHLRRIELEIIEEQHKLVDTDAFREGQPDVDNLSYAPSTA